MSMNKPYDQRNHLAGLEKGLAVIECFDATHQKLTIAEVAQAVGLSRAAARRCLLTLTHLGYADYDGKFFRLTVHAMRLGYAYLASTTMPQILQTFVERLSEETNESSSAATLDGSEMVYVARAAVKRILAINVNVGTRLPLFCTSLGRVLLAALDPRDAESRLASTPRPEFTEHTITSLPQLRRQLADVRANGYCLVEEELQLGLISLAVPVHNSSGRTVASICVTSQPHRTSAKQMLKEYLPKLLKNQEALSTMIQ
jgi:IclR family pca regulon transcriptional regulator